MNKLDVVEEVRKHMIEGQNNEVFEINDHYFRIKTPFCDIDLLFERFEDSYNVQLNDDSSYNEPLSLLLLCFLRKVEFADGILTDGKQLALLLNANFSDLLSGDFEIREAYDQVSDKFYSRLMYLDGLDENSPAKLKYKNFDLSWMEDVDSDS